MNSVYQNFKIQEFAEGSLKIFSVGGVFLPRLLHKLFCTRLTRTQNMLEVLLIQFFLSIVWCLAHLRRIILLLRQRVQMSLPLYSHHPTRMINRLALD